jgi:hypothetical protein
VSRAYHARSAELAYAGNVHVAQGRTVDTVRLLVTESLSRQALYVGMTRGRQANTAHVITGNIAPPDKALPEAIPESVLASVLQRDDGDLSATEQIRQDQDWDGGTGHLLTLWSAAVRQTLHRDFDVFVLYISSKSSSVASATEVPTTWPRTEWTTASIAPNVSIVCAKSLSTSSLSATSARMATAAPRALSTASTVASAACWS